VTRSFCTRSCSCITAHSGVNILSGDSVGEDSFGQSTESTFFRHVFRDLFEERHHGDFGEDPGGTVQGI
jgi:hypothetical protein